MIGPATLQLQLIGVLKSTFASTELKVDVALISLSRYGAYLADKPLDGQLCEP